MIAYRVRHAVWSCTVDEEITIELSVQELLAILNALDIALTALENLSHPDPVVAQQISTRLELLWPLEQRLQAQATQALEVSNDFNTG